MNWPIIRVIDLETTGEAPPAAKIVEIGWCDVIKREGGWAVTHVGAGSVLVDPGIPIPPEISAIHHIIDDDVRGADPIEIAGPKIWGPHLPIIGFAAHMAKFERQFVTDEMTGGKPWVCTYKCALRLWPDAPSHSNQSLRYWRKSAELDRDLAMVAHRAGPDAYVTAHHLRDMLNDGDEHRLEHMIKRSTQPALQVTCHIGDWRGKKWEDVDSGFLRWLLGKDFDEDVKFTARHWLAIRAERLGAQPPAHFDVVGPQP